MKKCLRITIVANFFTDFLQAVVQKHARAHDLEGTAQYLSNDQVRIVVCGDKEAVDEFLDILHKGEKEWRADEITAEPFIKEKDYRGVFRIIE